MKKFLPILLLLLFIKALFMALLIVSQVIGLGPDEAQYFTWSQSLDFGYYSKPPAVAWMIALGTSLFGPTEFGVRVPALFLSFSLSLAIFYLAKSAKISEKGAFLAAALIAFSPMGFLSSLFMTTDGGFILFWTLACIPILRALSEGKKINFLLVGLAIALGALFKWPIYLLWLLALPLFNRSYLLGFLLSLLGLLPSLYWNVSHDFVTFRHVATQVAGGGKGGNFLEFFASQALLFSPIFFFWLLVAFFKRLKRKEISKALLFSGWVTLLLLASYSALSFSQKIQANWCLFAYPTAAVFLSAFMSEKPHPRLTVAGFFLSLSLILGALMLPFLPLPFRLNPLRHNLGWKNCEQALIKLGYDPQKEWLLSDKYQTTSLLSFYSPHQKRAYFLNLQGTRKNQFSYWPQLEKGSSGFFVVIESDPYLETFEKALPSLEKSLQPYFESVSYRGSEPLFFVKGQAVKKAFFFECHHYTGLTPEESHRF